MIVVTGGAGFIGSNLIAGLNELGRNDILVVDDLSDGHKVRNLADRDVLDYVDKDEFAERIGQRGLDKSTDAVFHLGACSTTTEWDGRFVMRVNYEYSKQLLGHCLESTVPFVYASSASVYGTGTVFREERQFERPVNLYAYSKFLFDEHVRRRLAGARSQVAGLRYFNVYGPREDHKGAQASVALQLYQQIQETGEVRLFEGSGGYADGEQRRDFVWVGDVTAVHLWLLEHREVSGIFNVGTGRSQTFNDVATAVIRHHGGGRIRYVPFPEGLEDHYQSYTEADMTALRKAGYAAPFLSVEEAVPRYLQWLEERDA